MSTPSTLAPELRLGERGRAVAAAEVEDVEPSVIPIRSTSASPLVAHARRDAGEVALLPERLVRIHRRPSSSIEIIDCSL